MILFQILLSLYRLTKLQNYLLIVKVK